MNKKAKVLSIKEARKLVLHSQKIPPLKQNGTALAVTHSVIKHLGYIQIDTISAIQRAHHHTLWNRNPNYNLTHLDKLIADKKVFEYWSHAAAYLPMCDYRFSLIRKQAIAKGEQNHWYERDKGLMKLVLKRIDTEGPLMAKDFAHNGEKTADWGSKPAKRALEYLYMQGELMISGRHNFHKIYDLTERVLPENINKSIPHIKECARWLINRYLIANGLGEAGEISYLLKNTKPLISSVLQEMSLNGELVQIRVAKNNYFTLPSSLELLTKPLVKNKLKILSPFDNLLIQRKRILTLFDFDYQIECYVPDAKRQFGYFSLPVLWDGELCARMDCKAERKTSVLHIKHLALEPTLVKIDAFADALNKELVSFLTFNNCSHIKLYKTTPANFKPVLEAVLSGMIK